MSRYSAADRRQAQREAAVTNADTLRWARETYARFPNRHDLAELIEQLAKTGA